MSRQLSSVCIQIIHYQSYFFGILILGRNLFQKVNSLLVLKQITFFYVQEEAKELRFFPLCHIQNTYFRCLIIHFNE